MVHDQKENADEWKSKFQEQANTAADTVIDIALDPQGAAKTATVAVVKNVIHLTTDAFWPDGDAPKPAAPKSVTWAHDWMTEAGNKYEQYGGKFKPVTTPDGITWTGDAAEYAKEYNCPEFLNSRGQLEVSGSAEQQTAQRAAYNAWLKDPAVGQSIFGSDAFTQRDLGRHDGQDLAGAS